MNFRRTVLKTAVVAMALGAGAGAFAQSNVLRVATDATFPPMEFVENGKKTGFDVELVEAVAAKMGKKVEWVDIDFKGLVPGLIAKRYDMAVSAIYITEERKKVVDFTQSYYAGGLVAMVKDGSPIAKLTDLNGKKVSVQVGTKSVGFLTEHYPKVQRPWPGPAPLWTAVARWPPMPRCSSKPVLPLAWATGWSSAAFTKATTTDRPGWTA